MELAKPGGIANSMPSSEKNQCTRNDSTMTIMVFNALSLKVNILAAPEYLMIHISLIRLVLAFLLGLKPFPSVMNIVSTVYSILAGVRLFLNVTNLLE